MIRLTYAHRWTSLVDALADHLAEARSALGPLVPLTIVIPHLVASAYAKLSLADRTGIAANLRFTHLRPLVQQAYEASQEHRLLTPTRLEHLMLKTLGTIDTPALDPVRHYLAGDGPADRRRAQLARTLTRIFDDYLLTRPEMLQSWLAGDTPADETEAWQAELWRRLRNDADQLAGPRLVTLDEVLEIPAQIPPALFVFDVQLGTPILQAILAAWSTHATVELYATNPCMEFWEDLPAGGRTAQNIRARLVPRDGAQWSDPTDAGDPLPLLLWGRPGRENVRQLNQLTDCDFDGRFGPMIDRPTSVLSRLQQDVLHRAPPSAVSDDTGPAEESIVVLACPGARREAEVIVESIWAQVSASANDPNPLSFGDIGVVLAGRDADAYRSHFAAVFDEYHQIPHHFIDVPVSKSSRVVEAVELLLALPTSSFTRQDLLRLATHPTVLPDTEAVSAGDWVAWCEDLAIVHGADHDDHAGTYIEHDLLNWNQGLARLTLGLFMTADENGAPTFYENASGRYLPHDVAFDRGDSAAQLVTLARSLIADARFIARAQLSMRDWTALLRSTVTAYVSARDDADERDLLRVLTILDRLELDDLTNERYGYDIVQELLRDVLAELRENVGQPLADGVLVAPLRLAASVPLRVVYMPGLHEGAFPVTDQQSSLDIRRFDRRPGEIAPRERDQYQFLARLMATERQLYLSYVARDAATGEPRAAAPTVVELMRILQPYLGPEAEPHFVLEPPLRRYTGPIHRFASAAAVREAETCRLRESLLAKVDATTLAPNRLRALIGEDAWERLSARLGVMAPPDEPIPLPDTVTLRDLRLFLEDPLQGWAHHSLGLRQDERSDRVAIVDECFQTTPLNTHILLSTVLLEAVREGRDFVEVYAEHTDRLEVLGSVPTGVFKRADRQRHLAVLSGWHRALKRIFKNRPQAFDPIRFGRSTADASTTRVANAPTFMVGGVATELRGTTQPIIDAPPGSVILKVQARPPTAGPPTHELGAFIDQVVRSSLRDAESSAPHAPAGAITAADAQPYVVWTVYGDGQVVRTGFDPFDTTQATSYLNRLIEQLRIEPHAYLLPFSAIHRAYLRADNSDEAWATILAGVRPARFGPLAGISAPVASAEQARGILAERFGPFYDRRREEIG